MCLLCNGEDRKDVPQQSERKRPVPNEASCQSRIARRRRVYSLKRKRRRRNVNPLHGTWSSKTRPPTNGRQAPNRVGDLCWTSKYLYSPLPSFFRKKSKETSCPSQHEQSSKPLGAIRWLFTFAGPRGRRHVSCARSLRHGTRRAWP